MSGRMGGGMETVLTWSWAYACVDEISNTRKAKCCIQKLPCFPSQTGKNNVDIKYTYLIETDSPLADRYFQIFLSWKMWPILAYKENFNILLILKQNELYSEFVIPIDSY